MAIDSAGTLALLIDGDNATPKIITGLLAEIANYGTASVKRIYGDWTKPNLNGWKECLLEHSDSAGPAIRLYDREERNGRRDDYRRDGLALYLPSPVSASSQVIATLPAWPRASVSKASSSMGSGSARRPAPSSPLVTSSSISTCSTPGLGEQKEAEAVTAPKGFAAKPAPAKAALDRAALDMLAKAVTASADEDGRANLARVGAHLAKQSPDFDARNYGFPRLSDLVEASGIVEVERIGENPKIIMVRLKGDNLTLGHR